MVGDDDDQPEVSLLFTVAAGTYLPGIAQNIRLHVVL
jgi:hypothetical protein